MKPVSSGRLGLIGKLRLLLLLPFALSGSASEHHFAHSLSGQLGFGPADNQPGQEAQEFSLLRYQLRYFRHLPDQDWPDWTLHSRVWLDHRYQAGSQDSADIIRARDDGFSLEWRDFYLQRHRLFDDPRLSASIGRQPYRDADGIWWNNSMEALHLQWSDTFSHGFIALAHPLYSYNSSTGTLPRGQRKTAYLLGELGYRWAADHWAGGRVLISVDHDPDPVGRVRTYQLGLFAHGEMVHGAPVQVSDYRLNLTALTGYRNRLQPDNRIDRASIHGWAAVAETGRQFPEVSWQPRLALRLAMTDAEKTPGDGFQLNRIQSAKSELSPGFSSGLAGAMPGLTLANTLLYGLLLEARPSRRTSADLLLAAVECRAHTGPLPLQLPDNGAGCLGQQAGRVMDLNVSLRPFPQLRGRYRTQWFHRLNVTVFRNGNAIPAASNDSRISAYSELLF